MNFADYSDQIEFIGEEVSVLILKLVSEVEFP